MQRALVGMLIAIAISAPVRARAEQVMAAHSAEFEQEAEREAWGPQPGPQTTFAESDADIAIYGGAAGGGKTFSLLYEAVKWTQHPGVQRYRGIIFRRTSPELLGGGGLWDESQEIFRSCEGRPRGAPILDWTFEAGSGRTEHRHRVEFRHLHRENSVHDHQGRQYAFIGFDELCHFSERQFWYMVSRLRSMSGVRPYLRATCNPDPDSFVAKLIEWWIGADGYAIPERSGKKRWLVRRDDAIEWYGSLAEAEAAVRWFVMVENELRWFDTKAEAQAFVDADDDPELEVEPEAQALSVTFILSRLRDNPALTKKDKSYRGKLTALARVDRERLLGDEIKGGNWHVRDSSGLFFRRADFEIANGPPSKIVRTVRFWDKAASKPTGKHPDPDWTRGVRVSLCEKGELWIDDVVSCREGPVEVLRLMQATAKADGPLVEVGFWQDTAGAGKTDAELTRDAMTGYAVQVVESFAADTTGMQKGGHASSRPKRAFAKVWAPLVEQRRVFLRDEPFDPKEPWLLALLAECEKFPDGGHDDIVDAISGAMQVLVGQGLGFWSGLEKAAENLRFAREGQPASPLGRQLREALDVASKGARIAFIGTSAASVEGEFRERQLSELVEKSVSKTARGGLRFRKGAIEFFENETHAAPWVRIAGARVMRAELAA